MPEFYQTVFDRALAEARELIDRARLCGATSLSFASLAIVELPSELACLTDLTDLDLSGCRELTDLQPLAALTGLQSLDLTGCDQVQDLQPLAALRSLRTAWLMGVKVDCSPGALPLACWIRAVELYADQLIGARRANSSPPGQKPDKQSWPHLAFSLPTPFQERSDESLKVLFLSDFCPGTLLFCRF